MSELLIRLFVKNSENTADPAVRQKYGSLGGAVGIICNLFLCAVKIAVGAFSSSLSIMADGLNNLSDCGSSIITLIGFKLAGKPADRHHPFGHGRMEYMSAITVSGLILLVGAELFKSSLKALISGEKTPVYGYLSVIVLIISVIVKLWMYAFNRKLYKKSESEVFKATAQDSLNDMLSSTVILVSVGVSLMINLPFNLDAAMGLLVAMFILYSGITSAKDTITELLGTPPDSATVEEIKNTVLSFEGFLGIHDLIVHSYGPGRQFASVHVEVSQNTDFVKCHEQVDLCEKLIFERYGISLVIHMDPIDADNTAVKRVRNELEEVVKGIDSAMSVHDFRMTPACSECTNLIFDVVVPHELKMSHEEIEERISCGAREINPTYRCVITFDNDFTTQ